MNKVKKVTIQDVAKYANVSVGTIDRVIHNRGKVSPEKKQKIEEVIQKLNFNPNLLARTLALGNRFQICALIPSAPYSDHYWSIPKSGLEKAETMYKHFGVVVDIFYYQLFDESSFNDQAQKILSQNPDGIILAPLFIHESQLFVRQLEEKAIPYVFIDSDLPGQNSLSYIGPDLEQSAFIAAKLLDSVLEKEGDLLMLHMVKGYENAVALKRIESGFEKFFSNRNDNPDRIHKLTINSTNKEAVFRELTKFYIKNQNIKGVFVTNSKAFLVSDFHLTHELNIKIVGYDLVQENVSHLKSGSIDFLISQSPQQQGMKAVQSLFELFVYKKEPEKIQNVPLDIIIRENVDFYLNFN
ncbi:MAG: LacI family DNA-binding transcriptional regulator [Draconibacterium sp.]